MTSNDDLFRKALVTLLVELFDGPPGRDSYVLNPGETGLLGQLETINAVEASTRPMLDVKDGFTPKGVP